MGQNYDAESKFWFTDPLLRSKALSWIFFAHGGMWNSDQGTIAGYDTDTCRCWTHAGAG